MGAVDKPMLDFGGQPLLYRVARRLESVAHPVRVASGTPGRFGLLPWMEVADLAGHEGDGPIAGIAAALETASVDLVAVVAVDMPLLDPGLLRALTEAWDGETAIVPRDRDGRAQPLHAIYATSAAGPLTDYLNAGGRRLLGALDHIGARFVDAAVVEPQVAEDRWASNINGPDDIDRIARPAEG
jgi:molybdopterin-guanine dinucleotide biosynthesis protein A